MMSVTPMTKHFVKCLEELPGCLHWSTEVSLIRRRLGRRIAGEQNASLTQKITRHRYLNAMKKLISLFIFCCLLILVVFFLLGNVEHWVEINLSTRKSLTTYTLLSSAALI